MRPFSLQTKVRTVALQWAMFTASPGEDPLVILARAQLYEDYIRSGAVSDLGRARPDRA
jgi:hypothetical protein